MNKLRHFVIGMSVKRQLDRNLGELSGKGKLPKVTGAEFELRVLCPVSRVGFLDRPSVEQQTGAAVEIQDLVPGSNERVVVIGFSDEKGRDNGGLSSVQTALMLVFERMTEAGEVEEKEEEKGSECAIRMLVWSDQVFAVLGKDGSEIKEMESVSGARIVVVPRDELPLCVSASDEMIQVIIETNVFSDMVYELKKG